MKKEKKYFAIALRTKIGNDGLYNHIAYLEKFDDDSGNPIYIYSDELSEDELKRVYKHESYSSEDYLKMYERLRIHLYNEPNSKYQIGLKEIEIKEEKEKDEQIMIENKLNNNIIVNDFSEAYGELSQSYELEDVIYDEGCIEYYYNERTKVAKSFEGSWKFKSNNNKQFEDFRTELTNSVYSKRRNEEIDRDEHYSLVDFIRSITIDEFMNNKKDGMKLGKLLKKKGFNQSLLDYYSALDRKKEELYITISGASQVVAGMSNHGVGWSSCQATYDGGGMYNKHLLGSLADSRLLVIMITKEPIDEFTANMDDIILARSCAHVFNYEDKNILVPVGCYSSSYYKAMGEGIEHLQSLGVRIALPQNSYSGELLKSRAEVANVSQSAYYYVEVNEEIDVSCECPLCGGHGTISAYIGDSEYEHDVDCPLCGGSGEYETTVYINETFEDSEEVESIIGSYEENGLTYRKGYYEEYYGNYKTMRINEEELEKLMGM